jgi:hypothetical protein
MANVKGYFSGNFIKAEECKGGEICTIKEAGQIETITSPEGDAKDVLNYKVEIGGIDKTFTPNKENGLIMIEAWGEDDEKWIGRKFKITLEKRLVWGKRKNSIVVEPVKESAADVKTEKVDDKK